MTSDDRALALVTGGTGFIGSHFVDELLDAGYRVRAAVRAASDLRWLQGKEVERVEADLITGDLQALVAGVDTTFHVAGLTRGSRSVLERANVVATRRLVDAVLSHANGRRFVFCSSQAATGPGRLSRPRSSEDLPQPSGAYGRSKRAAELVLERADGLEATILRPPAVYGPRDRDTLPFFRMAQRGFALVPGVRTRRVQLVHARDVASAARSAAETPLSTGRAYFVAHPRALDWKAVIEATSEAVGRRVVALPTPSPALLAAGCVSGLMGAGEPGRLDYRRARDMVERAWTCDTGPATEDLGWTPAYDLVRGFRHTLGWYREKGWL